MQDSLLMEDGRTVMKAVSSMEDVRESVLMVIILVVSAMKLILTMIISIIT